MPEPLSLTTEEIQDLAGRLDASDALSDRDRAVLGGVFALAGAAVASARPADDEVSGFAMEVSPGVGAFDSFQWGAGQVDGDKAKGNGVFFLHFNFKLVAVKTVS